MICAATVMVVRPGRGIDETGLQPLECFCARYPGAMPQAGMLARRWRLPGVAIAWIGCRVGSGMAGLWANGPFYTSMGQRPMFRWRQRISANGAIYGVRINCWISTQRIKCRFEAGAD